MLFAREAFSEDFGAILSRFLEQAELDSLSKYSSALLDSGTLPHNNAVAAMLL